MVDISLVSNFPEPVLPLKLCLAVFSIFRGVVLIPHSYECQESLAFQVIFLGIEYLS